MAMYDAVFEHRGQSFAKLAKTGLVAATVASLAFGTWYAMNRSHILGTAPALTIADLVRPSASMQHLLAAHQQAVALGDLASADLIGARMMQRVSSTRNTTLAAFAMNDRALVLKALGRRTEAEALFREALAIGAGDPAHHQVVRMRNLAALLIEDKRYAEAEHLLLQIGQIAPDWMKQTR